MRQSSMFEHHIWKKKTVVRYMFKQLIRQNSYKGVYLHSWPMCWSRASSQQRHSIANTRKVSCIWKLSESIPTRWLENEIPDFLGAYGGILLAYQKECWCTLWRRKQLPGTLYPCLMLRFMTFLAAYRALQNKHVIELQEAVRGDQ